MTVYCAFEFIISVQQYTHKHVEEGIHAHRIHIFNCCFLKENCFSFLIKCYSTACKAVFFRPVWLSDEGIAGF